MDIQERGSSPSGQTSPVASIENQQGDEAHNDSNTPHSKWDPQHFQFLKTLSGGNFAAVYLVKSSQTQWLYAMKMKRKQFLQETSEVESIKTEKELLLLAKRQNHPFVVEVFGGFQTQSTVLLYLEFCQGGDLMHHVRSSGPFGIERAR
jgi:classical protein kinase C alpha type